MANYTTNLRMTADFGQAKQQADSFAESIKDMNSAMKEAMESGDYSQAAQLSGAINNLVAAQRMNPVNGAQSTEILAKVAVANQATQFLSSLTNTINAGIGSVTQIAKGQVTSALSTAYSTAGNMAMSGAGIAAATGNIPLAAVLAAGGAAANIAGKITENDQQLADDYQENILKPNVAFERYYNFEDANKYTEEYARNTGLSRTEIADLAVNEAQYGITEGITALERARETARYSYVTGVDSSTLQAFAGLSTRYGLGNSSLGTAYGSLDAAGLKQGQFGEYIGAIRKALEDGISKGFSKSTEEVVSNYIMLSELSNNNPLWIGEQGASRLQTINNSIASATDLQTVSDVMVYGAYKNMGEDKISSYLGDDYVQNGGYINYMMAMEKGVNLDVFKQLSEMIAGEGGYEAQIERVKQIFGLNYTGSTQILDMMKKAGSYASEADFQKAYTAITEAPEAKTQETEMQNAVNRLESYFDSYKENAFNVVVKRIEDVANITEALQEFGSAITGSLPQRVEDVNFNTNGSMVNSETDADTYDIAKGKVSQSEDGRIIQEQIDRGEYNSAQTLTEYAVTNTLLTSGNADEREAGVRQYLSQENSSGNSGINPAVLMPISTLQNGNDKIDDYIIKYIADNGMTETEIKDFLNGLHTAYSDKYYEADYGEDRNLQSVPYETFFQKAGMDNPFENESYWSTESKASAQTVEDTPVVYQFTEERNDVTPQTEKKPWEDNYGYTAGLIQNKGSEIGINEDVLAKLNSDAGNNDFDEVLLKWLASMGLKDNEFKKVLDYSMGQNMKSDAYKNNDYEEFYKNINSKYQTPENYRLWKEAAITGPAEIKPVNSETESRPSWMDEMKNMLNSAVEQITNAFSTATINATLN